MIWSLVLALLAVDVGRGDEQVVVDSRASRTRRIMFEERFVDALGKCNSLHSTANQQNVMTII